MRSFNQQLERPAAMGAWGIGAFENDDAADWLCDLEESSNGALIEAALQLNDAYLDAPGCVVAIAAAEVVAALLGRPMAKLPRKAVAWVGRNQGLDGVALVPLCVAAIRRIRNDSELKDLWEESSEMSNWEATLDDLVSRLTSRAL
ncbi:MAG: DUF4259 domain-containing protein [Luteolibacter sp.]